MIADTLAWLADPAHWQGTDGIPTRLVEHVWISVAAVVVALAIALPLGAFIGHTGKGAGLAINVANIGRAIPSYAVLVIVLPISLRFNPDIGLDVIPTFTAMTVLAIPPVLVNAYAGIREVDRDLVESARGMGMREREILTGVELPIALPVVVGGIRTAAVQVVATATLGAVVAYGGLGRYLIDGIARNELDRLFAGVVLVAGLALLVEGAFALLQRRLTSPGLRESGPRPFRRVAELPRGASEIAGR
ncbi:MAG TPA: ABC transporter permease [Candidatus Limnocylindrales bacterium]|nr:ABC transporter permease [Candidatus Limnocylindrales bacterium]